LDKEAVFGKIKDIMVFTFELDPSSITPDKKLHDDLQLDSLDMVDVVLNLNEQITGKKIEPTLFKEACTVQDLVDSVHPFLS
jgi:acyl carrier protein